MYLPTLKYLLMRPLAFTLLCASQISIYIINMPDFGEILMTLGLEAKTMLLKIWLALIIPSISSDMI